MGCARMIKVIRQYRYVVEDRDRHGNVRVYLRVPSKPKLRLWQEPGTPEFDTEYRRAIAGEIKPKASQRSVAPASGSLRALCISYFGCAEYKRMELRSRHVRRLILDKLCDAHGDKPAALMEPRHVRRIRDEKAELPEAANAIIKALRAVFRHGVQAELVSRNPAKDVEYLRSGSEGYHTWTVDEVEQFEARHPIGTKARLALALLLYTAQRRSDVVRFGRQHIRKDGRLCFTQFKNRNRKPVTMELPILPALQRIIDASPCGDLAFLVSERGTPFTADSFGNRFRIWCRQAGLDHCSAHGLRKAAATRLAELGASIHEIAGVTGHKSLKEVQRYTTGTRQRVMAEAAMARLAEQTVSKVSHHDDATPEWDENSPQPIEEKGENSWMVPRGGIEPPTLRFSVKC
jgi:integrase